MFEIEHRDIKLLVSIWISNTADYPNVESTSFRTNSSHTVISLLDLYQTTILLSAK